MLNLKKIGNIALNSIRFSKLRDLVEDAIFKGTFFNPAGHVRKKSIDGRVRRASDAGKMRRMSADGRVLRRQSSTIETAIRRRQSVVVEPTAFQGEMPRIEEVDGCTLEGRVRRTKGKLTMNFDEVNFNRLRSNSFIDTLKIGLQKHVQTDEPNSVCLSHIPERFYSNDLKRLMKRLGYKGVFSRGNQEAGTALFTKPKINKKRASTCV